MEAIILAGGFGTRLRPFTYTRAKALLPILNKPMISYLITSLPQNVDKIILAVNYRKDQIEQYFQQNDFGKEIIVNDEPEPLGTGGAVKYAEEHITGSFLVLNADIITSLNLSDMITFHQGKKAVSTISLWPVKNVSEFGVVDIRPDGNVQRFVEKPKPEDAPSDLINAGAYFLEPQILDYIETGRLVSMEKEIFPQIISDTGRFFGYQIKGYWIDVGRIQSYIDVHSLLLTQQHLSYYQGNNIRNKGLVEASCIGNNVEIGNGSRLHSSVVFNHVNIGNRVLLENCVLGENVHVGDNAHLKNTVVGDNEIVKKGSILDNAMVWTQPLPKGYPEKQIGNVIGDVS